MKLPFLFAACLLLTTLPAFGGEALSALLVGGGPDPESNAAQIESHVRFVAGLLPAGCARRVLFADGKADQATVANADPSPASLARAALGILLPNSGVDAPLRMQPPELGVKIDGGSNRAALKKAFGELLPKAHGIGGAGSEGAPLLVFFAGHGSRDDDSEEVAYNFWGKEDLSPADLAAEIARAPAHLPIVLVMAQCYSGAFADLLFQKADPTGDPIPQNLAGFFSARKDRTASGCGTATDAAEYQDFSSYFFGAASGRDRLGKPVTGADFDGDGRVSLHEAFCWAMARDESFDTPVCTSDAFLERFAGLSDDKIFPTPYAEITKAATTAQRAALDALSDQLGLTGEDRAQAAYDRLTFQDPFGLPAELAADRRANDELSRVRNAALTALFQKWPALRWSAADAFDAAANAAEEQLEGKQADEILAASDAHDATSGVLDNEEAHLIRFADLCRNVLRAQHLRATGDAATKARFERLREAENASLPLAPSKH